MAVDVGVEVGVGGVVDDDLAVDLGAEDVLVAGVRARGRASRAAKSEELLQCPAPDVSDGGRGRARDEFVRLLLLRPFVALAFEPIALPVAATPAHFELVALRPTAAEKSLQTCVVDEFVRLLLLRLFVALAFEPIALPVAATPAHF